MGKLLVLVVMTVLALASAAGCLFPAERITAAGERRIADGQERLEKGQATLDEGEATLEDGKRDRLPKESEGFTLARNDSTQANWKWAAGGKN